MSTVVTVGAFLALCLGYLAFQALWSDGLLEAFGFAVSIFFAPILHAVDLFRVAFLGAKSAGPSLGASTVTAFELAMGIVCGFILTVWMLWPALERAEPMFVSLGVSLVALSYLDGIHARRSKIEEELAVGGNDGEG
ncbi:hypothetical protein [Tateyamaria sp. SN3-11]|uniref:hypothetical protein n=1 Tax=Tateyamaria sp. SN3-11 TaxID=3092147 RepID=UPI0039E99D4C